MSDMLKCDYRPCGKTTISVGTYYRLEMGRFRRMGDSDHYDFCSWDCLSKYAAQRAPEEAPVPEHYKLDRHGEPYDPDFRYAEPKE